MASSLERYLAGLPGVQAAVEDVADAVYDRARTDFAAHNRPRGHKIIKRRSGPFDRAIFLDGPAPWALEFGHFTPKGEKFVNGIHVIGRAARGL